MAISLVGTLRELSHRFHGQCSRTPHLWPTAIQRDEIEESASASSFGCVREPRITLSVSAPPSPCRIWPTRTSRRGSGALAETAAAALSETPLIPPPQSHARTSMSLEPAVQLQVAAAPSSKALGKRRLDVDQPASSAAAAAPPPPPPRQPTLRERRVTRSSRGQQATAEPSSPGNSTDGQGAASFPSLPLAVRRPPLTS